jgi:hypothetical protein
VEEKVYEFLHETKMIGPFEYEVALFTFAAMGLGSFIHFVAMFLLPFPAYKIAKRVLKEKPRGYIYHQALLVGVTKLSHYPIPQMKRGAE